MLWILPLLIACAGVDEPEGPSPRASSELPASSEPVPAAPVPDLPPAQPQFVASYEALPDWLVAKMTGVSLHEGCPVGRQGLALLYVTHWSLEGEAVTGSLVVAKEAAPKLQQVFERLYEAKFVVERMDPVHTFGGSDDASMAANNTSAFNCRKVTGGKGWSEHSYGRAIDINPLRNPYVRGKLVLPKEGQPFVERDGAVPGVIVDGDAVVAAFAEIGWKWGGHWTKLKDYQHFSESGK